MFWRSIILAASGLVCFTTPGHTAIITVYKTADNAAGSLRQAIQDASPRDTIVFHIATTEPGYNSLTGIFAIGLTSGELLINKNLTIDAGGQKIWVQRLSGNFRIFGIVAGSTVTLSGLTIYNGAPQAHGGGIFNFGNLSVNNCTFYANTADSGNQGGAIYNADTLRVSNCTVAGNSSNFAGGAIYNSGMLFLDNSTISGNNSGLAVLANFGTAHMRNTIVVGNTSSSAEKDVEGNFISEGYNLIGTTVNSTGFGTTGDQLGVTPAQANLSVLRDNGGGMYTMRPLPGSVAIDQGKRGLDENNQPINTDQRGSPRPVDLPGTPNAVGGDGSDIGAVEMGALQSGLTLTVTNIDKHNDTACTTDDCTLTEAINAANANADMNTILFAAGVAGTIAGVPGGGYNIGAPVNIVGPGARQLSINAEGSAPIVFIGSAGVSISGLTLTNGRALDFGGAIYNGAGLTLTDCTISQSFALASGGVNGNGGGLYNPSGATATLLRCTFVSNFAAGFGGGGVFNAGTLTAMNCTLTGNTAPSGGGILSVSNNGNSLVTLRNCTITNNTATSTGSSTVGGGGYYGEGAVGNTLHHFSNTILAGNTNANNPDLRGFGTTESNNLIGNLGQGGSGFTNGVNGDKVGVSAGFNILGNNGGQTDTWSILGTSPARDAGNNANAPATDQRRYSRNGLSDMGAFEFNGTAPPLVPIVNVVSSKVHGAQTFGINLPLSGNPGVECRTGSAHGDFTIVFNFVNPLTLVGGASITSGAATIVPFAAINAADAHQYIVQLTGVVNAQVVTLQLTNMNDSLGNNTPVLQVPLGVLLGDANGNGSVNATDVSQAKLQSGQAVTGSNFRNDVTVSGSINATDVSSVKLKSGTALP
jgi:dockerin type I repeat protein